MQDVRIESAGTAAMVDHPVAPMMQRILLDQGIDASAFRARRLTQTILEEADLVVTAERNHRAFVSRLSPPFAPKSFTLLQLARLLDVSSPAAEVAPGVPRVLARAQAARGLGGPSTSADDIADPWGRRTGIYRRIARQLDMGVDTLATALTR